MSPQINAAMQYKTLIAATIGQHLKGKHLLPHPPVDIGQVFLPHLRLRQRGDEIEFKLRVTATQRDISRAYNMMPTEVGDNLIKCSKGYIRINTEGEVDLSFEDRSRLRYLWERIKLRHPLLGVGVSIVLADQIARNIMDAIQPSNFRPIWVIRNVFGLSNYYNQYGHAAFFKGYPEYFPHVAVTHLATILGIIAAQRHLTKKGNYNFIPHLSLSLLLGGLISNTEYLFIGHVRDFLVFPKTVIDDLMHPTARFWGPIYEEIGGLSISNFADFSLLCGCLLVGFSLLKYTVRHLFKGSYPFVGDRGERGG